MFTIVSAVSNVIHPDIFVVHKQNNSLLDYILA